MATEILPSSLLASPLAGRNLPGPSLQDCLDPERPTLVAFLRHLGWTFCRRDVEELRLRSKDPATPPILLVHLASPEQGERFFAARWKEARAVSDPQGQLYRAFGLGRGSFGQLFGPAVLLAGITHLRHGIGLPAGDPLVMSGWFLVDGDGRIRFADRHAHAGSEHPWPALLAAAGGPPRRA